MGYDIFAGWGVETTWGTPVARTTFGRVFEDSAFDEENPREVVTLVDNRDASRIFNQARKATASIVVPVLYAGQVRLWEYALGKATKSGVGPWTYTFDLDDKPFTRSGSPAALVGLTLEGHLDLPDAALGSFVLAGGRIGSFGASLRANEEPKATFGFVGKEMPQAAKTASPTFPDYDLDTVKYSEISIDFGSGAEAIYGIDFEVDNALRDDKIELGNSTISAPRARGKRAVTGTIDREWLTKTQYDLFRSGATASVVVTCTGAGGRSLKFDFAKIVYTGKTPPIQEGEEQDYQLSFRSLRHATKGALQVVLVSPTEDVAVTT